MDVRNTRNVTRLSYTNLLLLCFLVGMLLGSAFLSYPSLPFLLAVVLLIFTVLAKPFFWRIALFLLALSIGVLYTQAWRAMHWTQFPDHIQTTGTVVALPDVRADSTFLTIKPTQLLGLGIRGQPNQGKLLVKAPRYPVFHYGDVVTLSGSVEKPVAFSGFNYPLFLERSGIYGIVSQPKIILAKPAKDSVLGSLYSLQSHIETTIQHHIPEPESSFLAGILLGSKRAIPEDIQNALVTTGTSHIVAISGANITILLGIILQLLPLYSRKQQFWATLLIALFVTLLTGASASVVRGATIAILAQYIRLHGRRAWATPLILFSMTSILLNNPLLLRIDPGFQLSFAAYAGLAYLAAPITQFLEKLRWFTALPAIIKSSFTETVAATLGTAPLSFLLFGQLSLLGVVVNPLVLWLLPLTTFIGLAFVTTGWLPLLGAILSLPLWILLHTMLSIIRWFGQFTFAVIHWKT